MDIKDKKRYMVYLYKSPDCIRGWLAYVNPTDQLGATLTVRVYAESSSKAKNTAITQANKDISEMEILAINRDHKLWGVNNFPELREKLDKFYNI